MSSDVKKTCASGKFKRVSYYHGMLLTEQDFQTEQEYFREKMKLHNRLHGYGVAWGLQLKVRCVEIEGKPIQKIFLEPGLAFDCAGNEIVVCVPHLIPVDEKLDVLKKDCKELKGTIKLFVAIKYCECPSDPQPQYTSECSGEGMSAQMSRTREGYCLRVLEDRDVPKCCKEPYGNQGIGGAERDCPGLAACCEDEHVIVLGCISLELKTETEAQYALGEDRRTASDAGRNFTDKDIEPCCRPRYVLSQCLSPQQIWERHKQVLIHETCLASEGFKDFSDVVGKSLTDAKQYLSDLGMEVGNTSAIGDETPQELMTRIGNAVSCASVGTSIDVIVDAKGCVLFALPSGQ